LGDSARVRAEAGRHPQMYGGPVYFDQSEGALFGSLFSVEPVPPPCGHRVQAAFASAVLEQFDAPIVDRVCRRYSSREKVYCPTHYLRGYDAIFLDLSYEYTANSHAQVDVCVRQRESASARETDGAKQLGKPELLKLDAIARQLLTVSRCN
jgi:hypothetical protein